MSQSPSCEVKHRIEDRMAAGCETSQRLLNLTRAAAVRLLPVVLLLSFSAIPALPASTPSPLHLAVSTDGRHLTRDGVPFLWLGDTATRLSHRLDRADIDFYMSRRAAQGFNVILTSAVRAHSSEWSLPNQYGDRPFIDDDLTRPATTAGNRPENTEEYDWWDHIDYIVDTAAEKGLVVALVPFAVSFGDNSGFLYLNPSNAEAYGEFVGTRYKDRTNIIWVLGWDDEPDTADKQTIWNLMARGITRGVSGGSEDYSKTLMTFHTGSSSRWFHDAPWLDFNMVETHINYDQVHPSLTADYNLVPTKPTGIGEGWYEADHSAPPGGTPLTIRREAYWSRLATGYYTYGHMSIWHMGDQPSSLPDWKTALDTASAVQMSIFHDFFSSMAWWSYTPRQEVFASGLGAGTTLNAAARAQDGRSIIAYLSSPTTVSIRMDEITQGPVVAEIMNPQDGSHLMLGSFANSGTQTFSTPAGWEDALLLLHSAGG
jgi:hypothetical protein